MAGAGAGTDAGDDAGDDEAGAGARVSGPAARSKSSGSMTNARPRDMQFRESTWSRRW